MTETTANWFTVVLLGLTLAAFLTMIVLTVLDTHRRPRKVVLPTAQDALAIAVESGKAAVFEKMADAIIDASREGKTSVRVELPKSISRSIIDAQVDSLTVLGYTAKVFSTPSENVYRAYIDWS